MQKRKQSLLYEGIVRLFERICLVFGKSRLIHMTLNGYDTIIGLTNRSLVLKKKKSDGTILHEKRLLLRRWRVEGENSRFFGWANLLLNSVLRISLCYYGTFFFLGGFFHCVCRILTKQLYFDWSLGIVLLLFTATFPLLFERRSLWSCLNSSAFCSRLIRIKQPPEKKQTKSRSEGALWMILFSTLYGVGTTFIPMVYWCLGTLLLFAVLWIVTLPEVGMVMLMLLPILELFKHKTKMIVIGSLVLLFAWFIKLLIGRRHLDFSLPEVLVLALSAFFAFGGITPGGSLESIASGASRALLMLLYFPACVFFSNPTWRERGILAMQLTGGVVSVNGIVQYAQGKALLQWVDLSRFSDIGGRVTSCFSNPNILAVYLLLLIPIALCYTIEDTKKGALRLLYGLCFIAECGCLILTWSRGAWLGGVISVLLVLMLFNHKTRAGLLLGLAPLCSMLGFLPRAILNRFGSIGNLGESSIRYRRYLWRGTIRMLKENPWGIGMGEGAFSSAYLPYSVSGTETAAHSHQLLLQLVCDVGGIGAVVYCFLMLLIVLLFIRGMKKTKEKRFFVGVGGFCGLVGCGIMGLFDHIWYHNGLFALYWIVFALTRVNAGGEDYYVS